MRAAIDASCRVYRVMLYAYPSRLRHEFGDDMVSVFERLLVDGIRNGGPVEVCRIWVRTLLETAHIIARPYAVPANWGISAISLLGSSALFLFFVWAAGLARYCVK